MVGSDGLKKKRVLQMKRSLQKEELKHKLDDISGSDTEDVDFSKEIRPIGYYINDREKMIEEMFSIIKNDKFKKMLPPSLKRYSLEEIKADCLVQLLGMSKKRIYATLQGRDLNSSSDSETDSSNSVLGSDSSEEPQITSSTHVRSDVEEIDDALNLSVSKNDMDSLIQDKRAQSNTIRRRSDKTRTKPTKKIKTERSPSFIEISDDDIQPKKKKKDDKRSKKAKPEKKSKPKRKHSKEKTKKIKSESSDESSDVEDTTADGSVLVDSKKGKSLLEILELEMRARAIRALLEANTSVTESASKVKSDPENEKKAAEKINTSNDAQPAENPDESDSFDVEVINDYSNEDAIIILDDLDEQIILEPSDTPEPAENKPSKNDTSEKEKEIPKIETPEKEAPKSHPLSNTDTSESNLTWPQRWAESKGVKEIVQNSKLCANIRKRMRFARMLKQKQEEQQQQGNEVENPLLSEIHLVEEGSVDQLQLLKLLDETTQRSNELAKKISECNESEKEAEPEPTNTEISTNDKHSEVNDTNDEDNGDAMEKTIESNDKQNSSKSPSDIEVVEENITNHIDLTHL